MPGEKPKDKFALPAAAWALLPAGAAFAVFSRSLNAGFLNWDDISNFAFNREASSFSAGQLRRIFLEPGAGTYSPLTTLSAALDHLAWGGMAAGHHLTSVLLHCANAALFFFVCRELLAAVGAGRRDESSLQAAACAGALFFALHPLRTESVAWLSARHDVLCALFLLGAVLAYLRGRRLLPLLLFVPALLAKPTAACLPPVLLALDAWPLGRLAPGRAAAALKEKLPYFALALAFGLLAVRQGSFNDSGPVLGAGERLAQAALGAVFYPLKTLLPAGLKAVYRLPPGLNLLRPDVLAAAAAVAALTAAAWAWRRRAPGPAAAWACYLLIIWPLLGFFNVGFQAVAERYSYLAGLPFAALAAGGALALLRRRPLPAALALALAAAALGAASWRYQAAWLSSEALWRHAVRRDPGLAIGYLNLGAALGSEGRADEARAFYRRAVLADPRVQYAHLNLAWQLLRAGRPEEALRYFRRELANMPAFAPVFANIALSLSNAGRHREAAEQFRLALKVKPDMPQGHDGLGVALSALGRWREAEAEHRQALRIKPNFVTARYNLAYALERQGRLRGAEENYRLAIAGKPGLAAAHNNLGTVLAAQGRAQEAELSYREAVRLDPEYAEACYNLGTLLHKAGRLEAAAEQYAEAVRLAPGYAAAHYNLALALYNLGRLEPAMAHLKRAVSLDPGLDPRRRR